MMKMVKVRKNIVSNSVASKVTYGGTNPKKYIVIHETANTSKGANADAHGRLQANGNSRQASWHYTVDDKEVVQSFSDNAQCWHAGSTKYNKESIGIEICVNSDGNFKKAVDNAIELTKQLMSKYNISASNVIQHNTASGKDCPKYLRAGNKGITWSQFKAKLSDNKSSNTNASKSNKKPITSNKSSFKKYTSIVDYLKDNKIDSSFANRKKLATKHGIKNYTGTAAQNAKLLSILQGGKTTANKPKKTQAKGTVHLPASAKTWRTYKLNVQPVAKNSDWSLTPSRYGGLTYDILGRPYPDVVTINTSKGKRNIYVGKGTGAVVR